MAPHLLFDSQEYWAAVGAMNVTVAIGAGFGGPCIRSLHVCSRLRIRRWKMARLADCVDVGASQQMEIRATVRKVTCRAALGFDDRVFEPKWSGSRGMAIDAEGILTLERPWKLLLRRAMRIVAVSALDQALRDVVARRHRELRLNVGMAAVAKLGLVGLQQILRYAGGMDAVAAGAACIAFAVSGPGERRMLARVTSQAHIIHLRGIR